jgi:Kdo2-lipid IVA lauroyltransferase/acyltransferase
MTYYLYMTGFFLSKIVPLKLSYLIAGFVAWVFFLFSKADREEMSDNLRVVLGPEAPRKVIDRNVRAIFKNFAKYLADFVRFPKFSEQYISENIEIKGRENLDKCLSEGKGVILVALHLGNWELGAALVGALGYDLRVIALEHSNARINNFFNSQRAINGVKSIPTGANIKSCFRALGENNIVAIAADKDYTSTGIDVDFFGRKTLLPRGAAVISLRTGSPIIFTALTREKGDRFRLVFEKPILYRPTGDAEKDVRGLIREYVKLFEKYILAYPDQWYAFRRIWKLRQGTL